MTGDGHVVPEPLGVPAYFSRHAPSVDALREVVRAWTPEHLATRSWPDLVDHLMAVGRSDIPVARLVEAHVDAVRIHAQAGTEAVPGALYAVWASRSQATGLRAAPDGDAWVLDGTLRFASGAGIVDRALVPVWTGPETHVLLDLDVSGWEFDPTGWHTRAMATARSHTATLTGLRVVAPAVGADNFYLDRPGFFPGGVAVAAAWAGGLARVHDLLGVAVPTSRRSDAQTIRAGHVVTELTAVVAVLRATADRLQAGTDEPRRLATLARAATATGVRRALADVRSVAGAAGLAMDQDLTRAVDDLFLFVAQQNEDADALWIGSQT